MPETEIKKKRFDLEERTTNFGVQALRFARSVPKNLLTAPLISQFIRSATSIGANYCEANCAESKKDFVHKIGICKKEASETRHWLRMFAEAVPELKKEMEHLQKEAHGLQLIFIAIAKKTRANM